MKTIFTLAFILFSIALYAQGTGSIVGTLTDKDSNNEPLPFANVIIKGTATGTTSDFDGLYAIENLEAGNYILEVSFVGYETVEVPSTVIANQATTVNIPMGACAAALDEVIITTTTKRESEVALLLEQKKATTIKQSIGSDELARKGVSDAAGAVTKISGISKQEGGGNVYVRGLGDRYLNTTYNGLSLPSNDVEKKNMNLNLFSSDVIQNVSVSKAYSSEFYGDFAAGNVNIMAKDYSGNGFLDVSIGSRINTQAADKNFVRNEGTGQFGFYNRYDNNPFAVVLSHGIDPVSAGAPIRFNGTIAGGDSFRINDESKISAFFTASFDNNFEYRDGVAIDFAAEENKGFDETEVYEYSTTTTAMTNLIYRINSDNRISFNSLFINSSKDEVGYYGTDGLGRNRNAIDNTDKGFFQLNAQFNQDMIYVNQLLGSHKASDKLKLNWGIGYNKVDARQPDRRRISLERYDLALDNDPTTNPTFFNNIPYDNQRYFQDIEDTEFNGLINLEYISSENLKFNVGYNGRTKERSFENIRYGYDFLQPDTEVTDINNLDGIFNLNNFGNLYNTVVFNAINPSIGLTNNNLPGLPENTYNGILNIYAGYVNAEIKASEKLSIFPGVRVEAFDQKITYDVINLPASDPGFRAAKETFFLPALNVKYALSEDENLRFGFSKTVSVPEFKEISPFVYEDVTQRVGGNPDLLNDPSFSQIYNLDIKYEWFYGRSEIFSIAAFAKQINDPVNKVIANDATGTQRYFRTGDKAEVLGLELEARKNILLDAEENTTLSAGFNATYMYMKQDLKNAEGLYTSTFNRDSEKLQGASPLLINADISYRPSFENYKPMFNVVYSYFSDRIDAIGSGQLGNIVEKSVSTLDLVWKNQVTENFEINASAKNLLNPNIERVREEQLGDITLSSYKRGINLALQLKYNF